MRVSCIVDGCLSLREADYAFEELERFLNTEIEAKERKLTLEKDDEKGVSTTSKNLFSRVVLASQLDGPLGLTKDEIRGNLFIYLFAGVRIPISPCFR